MSIILEPRWCPSCLVRGVKIDLSLMESKCPRCGHTVTCDNCDNRECDLRNDPYNTDGDCLWEK